MSIINMEQEYLEKVMAIENIFHLESYLNEISSSSIEYIIRFALKNQKLEILDRIHCFGIYDHITLGNVDAEIGLESLKWVLSNYPKIKLEPVFQLIEKNRMTDMDLIRTARKNGFGPSIYLCALSAKENDCPNITIWLNENGHQNDECVCAMAAYHGNLELLKWLRERGCPWDSKTCESAIEGNHLDVLIWARENHCPWNKYAYLLAKKKGNVEIIGWIKRNGSFKESKKLACVIS